MRCDECLHFECDSNEMYCGLKDKEIINIFEPCEDGYEEAD
ncbi:hypothetical protein [Clostridium thermarum]|nr:hypothetical protein [Clostridium thermarum]